MAEVELSHVVAGLGGSGVTGLTMYFLKDFLSATKRDLRENAKAITSAMDAVKDAANEVKLLAHDMRRVEGVMESQQRQLTEAVKEMSGLTANIKALWAALQRIHPTVIKKRMSDGD